MIKGRISLTTSNLQIVGISLTDKTNLKELFDKSNINNVNERCDSSKPSLFNF